MSLNGANAAPEPNLQDSKMSDKQTERPFNWIPPSCVVKLKSPKLCCVNRSPVLRGTRLQAIMDRCERDDDRMIPHLQPRKSARADCTEIAEMDPADLTAMSVEVVTFAEEVGACRFTDSLTVDDPWQISPPFSLAIAIHDVMPLTEVLEYGKAIQRSGANDE